MRPYDSGVAHRLTVLSVCVASWLMILPPLHAERVVLKNGSALNGTIVVRKAKTFVIKTDDGRTLELKNDQVASGSVAASTSAQPAAPSAAAEPSMPSGEPEMPFAPGDYAGAVAHAQAMQQRAYQQKQDMVRQMLEAEGYSPQEAQRLLHDPRSEYYVPQPEAVPTFDAQAAMASGNYGSIIDYAQSLAGRAHALQEQTMLDAAQAEGLSPEEAARAIRDPRSAFYVQPPETVDGHGMMNEMTEALKRGDTQFIMDKAAEVNERAKQKQLETERAIREMEMDGYPEEIGYGPASGAAPVTAQPKPSAAPSPASSAPRGSRAVTQPKAKPKAAGASIREMHNSTMRSMQAPTSLTPASDD